MKSIFFGLLLSLIISIISSLYTKKYKEDPDNMMRRLNYLKSYSDEITNGFIDYVYTPETGIYCTAKKDISKNQSLFTIPSKHIISVCKKNK